MREKELSRSISVAASKLSDILPRVNSFLERYAIDFEKKDIVTVEDVIRYQAIEFISKVDNKFWTLYIEPGINEYGFIVLPSKEFNRLTGRGF